MDTNSNVNQTISKYLEPTTPTPSPHSVDGVTDPSILMHRIVAQSLVLIPSAEGAVIELKDGDDLVYTCCGGSLSSHVGLRVTMKTSLSGLAMTSNRVLRSDNTDNDHRVDRAANRKVGAISMLCVPLRSTEGPIGVLKVTSSHQNAFGPKDTEILRQLAPFITSAIATAQQLADAIPTILRSSDRSDSQGLAVPNATSHAMKGFIANVLSPNTAESQNSLKRVLEALSPGIMMMVVQPIVELDSGSVFGLEALARFKTSPQRSPDRWFAEAHAVGLGAKLELNAIALALSLLEHVPNGTQLAINLSPATLLDPHIRSLLDEVDASRIVLEITEHQAIEDYPKVISLLKHFRAQGVRIAVDDTGAGISGLTHILRLAPDLIKLDRELTLGIEFDPVRQALARALTQFASQAGARVIAEGIETNAAMQAIYDIGIPLGQGYYIARPSSIDGLSFNARNDFKSCLPQ